jgi:3-deoxy-D-manno-octulosonic-acid transferase
MMGFLYNLLVIPLLTVLVSIGSLFDEKIRERVRGERTTWQTLSSVPPTNALRIWFHAASMGEFEQVKPVIERIKQTLPETQIIASFFSPSGFRTQHQYALADAVVYLPLDSKRNAQTFLNLAKPDVAVFARYDLWPNFVHELRRRSISSLLVCATLNERSLSMRSAPLRSFQCALYASMRAIYTTGEEETKKFKHLFKQSGLHTRIITAADTRFDRIIAAVAAAQGSAELIPEHWFHPHASSRPRPFVLVVGSSWKEDEVVIVPAVKRLVDEGRNIKLIVVPHEPTHETITRIQICIRDMIRDGMSEAVPEILSAIESGRTVAALWGNDIVVDSVGKLLRLYSYADAAYIGGGFGAGVHSVAEPAGYGIPLACGPRIDRARDAAVLRTLGALCVLHSVEGCYKWLKTLLDEPQERARRGQIASYYIHSGTGWSERIAADVIAACGKAA